MVLPFTLSKKAGLFIHYDEHIYIPLPLEFFLRSVGSLGRRVIFIVVRRGALLTSALCPVDFGSVQFHYWPCSGHCWLVIQQQQQQKQQHLDPQDDRSILILGSPCLWCWCAE